MKGVGAGVTGAGVGAGAGAAALGWGGRDTEGDEKWKGKEERGHGGCVSVNVVWRAMKGGLCAATM